LKEEEIAEILEVSVRTIERDWVKARAWLYQWMHASPMVEA
jgi:DNA-directed RNA polymerase specialized sigma24 family protein